MQRRDPEFPWLDGAPTHLPCSATDVPEAVIVPGDPARVDRFAAVLEGFRVIGQQREFRYGVGFSSGTRIGVCSTGIGGPSTEIALVELFNLGARTFLRAGGMGALDASLPLGGLVSAWRVLRNSGSARVYDENTAALVPDASLQGAIHAAGDDLGIEIIPATIMSTDSYYLGQGRPISRGAESNPALLAAARKRGAQGFDMEAETVLAVGRRLGARAAAILMVHGNRASRSWLEAYDAAQERIVRLAVHALGPTSRSPD